MRLRVGAAASVVVCAITTTTCPVYAQPVATSEHVVRALYAAFNTQDAVALVAHVSEDVRWMRVAGGTVVVDTSGREALHASMSRYFRSMPTVRSRIEALMPAGDFVTVHEHVTWTHDSTERTQSAVAVYRLQDAKIVSVWYFDTMR